MNVENDIKVKLETFLSCLFGSEQCGVACGVPHRFLSCLFGSELEPETGN